MKITLHQLISSKEALQNLLAISLPVKISYLISRIVNKINPELVIFEEKRNNLIKELGEDVGEGNMRVTEANIPKFTEALEELNKIEVDLGLEKIKIDDLGDIKIAPKDLPDWLFLD